jgi:hypothetical protein
MPVAEALQNFRRITTAALARVVVRRVVHRREKVLAIQVARSERDEAGLSAAIQPLALKSGTL